MTEENSPNDLLPTIVQLKIQPAADLSEDRVGECVNQYKSFISWTISILHDIVEHREFIVGINYHLHRK